MSLLQKREKLLSEIKHFQEQLDAVNDEIFTAVKDKVPQMGSVTLEFENQKITVTIPKTVKWDQLLLKQIAAKIQASGDDPESYIRYELKVLETAYKAWSEQIQTVFLPARTVTPGKVKVEVK